MAPSTIANRYLVDRAVGRGGMGTVWLCTDGVLGRTVAVKQVGHAPGESTPDLARALREARSAAALNHPNVVSIFDAIDDGDQIWLVMEYVPGRTLSEIMEEEGRLDPARVAWIGAQVADGLAAAHLRGTMHRDVKPGNILVADNDHAKISDFGIARTMGDSQLTQTGMVTGTPGYFSPSLARGEDPSPADDVWALGATLFAAVEGHPPWPDQSNALAMLSTIATSEPPKPERAGPLTDAIVNMMDLDPASRWSMADVAYNLHHVQDQQTLTGTHEHVGPVVEPTATLVEPAPTPAPTPVPAPSGGPTRSGTRPDRRRRWPLVLLVLAAAAVVLWTFLGDDPDETPGDARDRPSGQASPNDRRQDQPNKSQEPTLEDPAQTPQSDDGATGGGPVSTQQFVADYYALLPGDTDAAWPLLSSEMQAEVGSYDDYVGFWSTIDSVSVDDTTALGETSVEVTLTYTTDGVSEQEVRQIDLTEQGDSFVIVGD
jgi:serine/threonine protein kinase